MFAAVDLVFDQRQPPRILQLGRPGHGDLALLVVIDGSSTTFPSTTALAGLGLPIGRLGLAEVLPKGGPLLDERRAAGELQQVAVGLGDPELALLFGRPDEAITDHASARGYDVIITPYPDPVLSARLRATGRAHLWGDGASGDRSGVLAYLMADEERITSHGGTTGSLVNRPSPMLVDPTGNWRAADASTTGGSRRRR